MGWQKSFNLGSICRIGSFYLKKDIDLLEKVQRRATRLMTSDKSLSYTDRLQKFGLTH